MDQVGVVAVVVVAYGLVSRLLERTPLTVPLAFTAAGMAAGGLGLVEQDLTGGPVLTLLELTLVVVLFSDAARIDLGAVRRTGGTIPLRLLGLGETVLLPTPPSILRRARIACIPTGARPCSAVSSRAAAPQHPRPSSRRPYPVCGLPTASGAVRWG